MVGEVSEAEEEGIGIGRGITGMTGETLVTGGIETEIEIGGIETGGTEGGEGGETEIGGIETGVVGSGEVEEGEEILREEMKGEDQGKDHETGIEGLGVGDGGKMM